MPFLEWLQYGVCALALHYTNLQSTDLQGVSNNGKLWSANLLAFRSRTMPSKALKSLDPSGSLAIARNLLL